MADGIHPLVIFFLQMENQQEKMVLLGGRSEKITMDSGRFTWISAMPPWEADPSWISSFSGRVAHGSSAINQKNILPTWSI